MLKLLGYVRTRPPLPSASPFFRLADLSDFLEKISGLKRHQDLVDLSEKVVWNHSKQRFGCAETIPNRNFFSPAAGQTKYGISHCHDIVAMGSRQCSILCVCKYCTVNYENYHQALYNDSDRHFIWLHFSVPIYSALTALHRRYSPSRKSNANGAWCTMIFVRIWRCAWCYN